jgi:hypothetical protein
MVKSPQKRGREGKQRKNGRGAGRQTKNLLLLPSLLTPEPAADAALALVSHNISDLEGDCSSDRFEGIEP